MYAQTQSLPLQMEINVIPANPMIVHTASRNRQLRVSAYCRVSTDQEEQQSSYEAQIDYYTDKIANNPEWTLAGIFADEGITGTSVKKRPQFLKLIQQCKKGKIDMVLTKSISRFARNTLDCLNYIRMLKELKIPVVFEKEGINTMKMASEMAITMMGCFAQAESESISQNVTWGKRQSFKNGKVSFNYSSFLGYEKGEDGKPKIVPEQAEIIRRIFNSYLAGYSIVKIKREFERDGILTSTGKTEWSQAGISNIIKNEKYTGDALLQKTYVTDVLTKKTKKNNGELPQYYVKNSHEGIIGRDLFNQVQEEIARRNSRRKVSKKNATTELSKYSSKYALTELLICGNCGTHYRRVTWSKNRNKKIVWRCINRLDYGTKYCKDSPTIEECKLQDAIMRAISIAVEDKDEVIGTLKNNLRTVLSGKDSGIDVFVTGSKIKELQSVILDLVQASVKSDAAADYFDEKFKEISDKIKALQETLCQHEAEQRASESVNAKMNKICEALECENVDLTEYNEQLVRQIIETVKVISKEKVLIIFNGGFEIEQRL